MEISQLLSESRINFDLHAKTKNEIIVELVDMLDKDGKLINREQYTQAVLKREAEYSTGIGMGIAIPHGKDGSVKEAALAFGISKYGVDYQSMDGTPAHIFFLIAVPLNSNDVHLHVLSYISRKLMHQEVREKLLSATSYQEVLDAFK